eukprot:887500-Prymnesium_polylepis.2
MSASRRAVVVAWRGAPGDGTAVTRARVPRPYARHALCRCWLSACAQTPANQAATSATREVSATHPAGDAPPRARASVDVTGRPHRLWRHWHCRRVRGV